MTGRELSCIAEAGAAHRLAGDGQFTHHCHRWLETRTGCHKALLTHSCTAALEMAALLLDTQPGDEFIMPSYTFVSTANAFVLRGGVPVFVDIRPDTLNLDERLVEAAITPRTRAIVAVHYAGVACNMDALTSLARHHRLAVIEDAAQGVMATYRGRPLGSIGQLGTYSFHETKNVIAGEGGALLINAPEFTRRAEIIREKGTDRSRFFRGEVDKYTWQEPGSSYLPGELVAAFLWAQLQEADAITRRRVALWTRYHEWLEPLETKELLRRPIVPSECDHNAHMYYVLLPPGVNRQAVIADMKHNGIDVLSHFVPLHTSPAGRRYGRTTGDMAITDSAAGSLLRLPLWLGMEEQQHRVVDTLSGIVAAHATTGPRHGSA